MKIGRNAILGIGNPTEMIGSKNQCTKLLRAIRIPRTTPVTDAIVKPTKARYMVSARLVIRSPEVTSVHIRAATTTGLGIRKGVVNGWSRHTVARTQVD